MPDEAREQALARYEGSFSELAKLALERFARTTLDPIVCFESAMEMMRLRDRLLKERGRKL
jgi:hypothetical protein